MTAQLRATALLSPPSPSSTNADLPRPGLDDSAGNLSSIPLDFFRYTPIPTIILDASLFVCQLSDSYLRVSGAADRHRLLGCHATDFFDQTVTLPSLTVVHQAVQNAQATAQPHQFKHVYNSTIWSIRSIPIFINDNIRYFQLELQDITEEYKTQQALEEQMHISDTIRILVDTVRDYAIFMLDPHGNVATWNAGAESFKGYTKEQIVGKHFSNFYSQEDRENDKPGRELRDALRDGRVEDEGWRYRSDGSRFWANVVITPVYRDSTLIGFGKVTRDLTDRKKAESRLIAAYEEASKLKSEFLANMSHEIRTPMHGMLSALTLLLDTGLDAEQLELTGVIQESGEVLLQLINDILDYSKLASGSFSISHDIISVVDIIQSIFRAYQKCSKPNVNIECFLDPQLPKSAEGDSLRYRQIVQNLVSNAHKFTEQGYVRINATLQSQDEEYFTILTDVVDTGIGIPEGASSALFTPFTQFDNSATKKFKGTGLGLSICRSLAELMGGRIAYRPNPEGQGSSFWFTAKLKKVQHMKGTEGLQNKLDGLVLPSPSPIPLREQLRTLAVDRRLLLAEDNPINQKVMLKMLSGLGFANLDVALDGRQAINKATTGALPYDIILMDINMPILDGVSATKEIRDSGIQTPIIAITANALKGQAEMYIAKGMTGCIAKPVDRKLLVKALLHCLKRNSGI